jgi:hypothetical protein
MNVFGRDFRIGKHNYAEGRSPNQSRRRSRRSEYNYLATSSVLEVPKEDDDDDDDDRNPSLTGKCRKLI